MKIIEKLSEMMEEEMDDSEKYIKCALKWKEDDMMLSKMFSDLSASEINHALMLHDNATRLINEYRQRGNEVPAEMQAVYDYIHEKHMDRLSDIKLMQATFKS